MVTQLAPNILLLNEGRPNASVLHLVARDTSFSPAGMPYDHFQHVRWGAADNQPQAMRRLIQTNTSVRSLLESLRDMIYGSGVGFFKRTIVEGKIQLIPFTDTRLEEWAFATNLQGYVISSINQRVDNANIFTRWQYSPMDDWFYLSVSDSFKTRIGKPSEDFRYHVNPFFGEMAYQSLAKTDEIAPFNPYSRDENVARTVVMHHQKEQIPGQPFYAFPSWWCAQEAIELANLITAFHKNGILNGYNIKYLIKMPQDHFDRDGSRAVDGKEAKERWRKFGDNLSGWLAGQKNVNKTMLIKYMRGAEGKMMDNVDVVPLKNEMSDDAYDKVWNNANQAIANSVGLLPTLAGVKAGAGNDSGSQIRVMADYQQHFRTPIHRHIVLESVNHALRMMGYRDVIAGMKEVQITTLDVAPTGSQAVVNHGQ